MDITKLTYKNLSAYQSGLQNSLPAMDEVAGSLCLQDTRPVHVVDGECTSSNGFYEKKRLEDFRIVPQCEFEGKLRSSAEVSLDEKPGFASTAKLPLNFIWVGSLIPDKYAKNIFDWANAYPQRLTVLWITSTLLSEQAREDMVRFEEVCPENVRVMDTVINPLLNNIGFADIERWIFNGFETMSRVEITRTACAYSDVLRVLLMFYGTELLDGIKQGPGDTDIRTNPCDGMIYLDTDIYYNSLGRMDDLYFRGVLFKCKFLIPEFTNSTNDIFATSHARSDYFGCLMHEVLTITFALMSQYSSCAEYVRPNPDDLRSNELRVCKFSFMPADNMVTRHYGGFAKKFEDETGAKPFPLIEKACNDYSWVDGSALDFQRSMFRPRSLMQRSVDYFCSIL
ncbi:hypothetical protein [Endozoicomonas sp. YOMI1]|uniref:hypothetical protein n=1 Tax=Endozoicomonas sp. YOMI1 TaxID=2828739 RepID=UPI00214755D7|nr:hypothetical protein [Endozoicomonas sp. YOMI1]